MEKVRLWGKSSISQFEIANIGPIWLVYLSCIRLFVLLIYGCIYRILPIYLQAVERPAIIFIGHQTTRPPFQVPANPSQDRSGSSARLLHAALALVDC